MYFHVGDLTSHLITEQRIRERIDFVAHKIDSLRATREIQDHNDERWELESWELVHEDQIVSARYEYQTEAFIPVFIRFPVSYLANNQWIDILEMENFITRDPAA